MFRTDMLCEIGGFHSSAAEDCSILGCDAVSPDGYLLSCQWIVMPSSSATSDTNALSHADDKTEVPVGVCICFLLVVGGVPTWPASCCHILQYWCRMSCTAHCHIKKLG